MGDSLKAKVAEVNLDCRAPSGIGGIFARLCGLSVRLCRLIPNTHKIGF